MSSYSLNDKVGLQVVARQLSLIVQEVINSNRNFGKREGELGTKLLRALQGIGRLNGNISKFRLHQVNRTVQKIIRIMSRLYENRFSKYRAGYMDGLEFDFLMSASRTLTTATSFRSTALSGSSSKEVKYLTIDWSGLPSGLADLISGVSASSILRDRETGNAPHFTIAAKVREYAINDPAARQAFVQDLTKIINYSFVQYFIEHGRYSEEFVSLKTNLLKSLDVFKTCSSEALVKNFTRIDVGTANVLYYTEKLYTASLRTPSSMPEWTSLAITYKSLTEFLPKLLKSAEEKEKKRTRFRKDEPTHLVITLHKLHPDLAGLIRPEEARDNPATLLLQTSFEVFDEGRQYKHLYEAYTKTEEMMEKVRLSDPSAQDLSFLADIHEKHYPALTQLMQRANAVTGRAAGHRSKEKVVREVEKQLEILQRGLAAVLQRQVHDVIDDLTAQTETLRREVQKNSSLTVG